MAALFLLFVWNVPFVSANPSIPGIPGSDRFFPDLLITEIGVNPSKGNSRGEGYEFVELYNNTDHRVNIRDYNLRCDFPDGTFAVWDIREEKWVEPGEPIVIWTKNSDSYKRGGELTRKDFNQHYKTALKDIPLATAEASGMSNIHDRKISVTTDTGIIISEASYIAGAGSPVTRNGESLVYEYPKDGSSSMTKRGISRPPHPGRVLKNQVPAKRNRIVDHMKPAASQANRKLEIPVRTDLPLAFNIEDDRAIVRATIFYKRHQDKSFTEANITPTEINHYSYDISRFDVYASNPLFEYYLEASDGVNTIRYPESGTISVKVGSPDAYQPFKKGMSITNDSILSGTKVVEVHKKHAGERVSLFQNGSLLKTKNALSRPPALVFEADGIKEGYKNGLFIKKQLIKSLEPTRGRFSPFELTLPIEAMKKGRNNLTVTAGSRKEAYSAGMILGRGRLNNFEIKNVKLLLGDGTILRPSAVRAQFGNGKDVKESYRDGRIYTFGEGKFNRRTKTASRAVQRSFVFAIPPDKFLTERAVVKTERFPDGRYNFSAIINDSEKYEVNPKFDNSPPEILIKSPSGGSQLKGTFTVDAESNDSVSKWSSLRAALDGKRIKLPFTTNTGQLKPGNHKLVFTASDAVGNSSRKIMNFRVGEEAPIIKDTVYPPEGSTSITLRPKLSVKVKDPTGDRVKTVFYKASRYDFSSSRQLKGYMKVSDREPPLELEQEGEKDLNLPEKMKLAVEDGEYLVSGADTGFPYQRFEAVIKEKRPEIKEVELEWTGHSANGRRVILYAWNYSTYRWDALAYGYGDRNYTLKAQVNLDKYVKKQRIQVLIQDPPEKTNQNFTLLWMSDTQYYSSTFPFIYPIMTNWAKLQYDKGNAGYVIHTGDIVDFRWDMNQWETASKSMAALDQGNVPYGVAAGNHDVGSLFVNYTNFGKYFGKKRFVGQPSYGGERGNNALHYDLISFGGHDFIILYLGWGKETSRESIDWSNRVLKKYSDRNAILAVHSYLDVDGRRTSRGQSMFQSLVMPNQNVKMVLSGHYFGASRHIEKLPDGRKVIEMLADYQGGPEGGQGYMRLLQFDPLHKQLRVKTYSPYLDHYNFFDSGTDEFILTGIELNPIHKQVATDYLSVNVYTSKKLGEDADVRSSRRAQLKLKPLKPDSDYYWYVEVSDKFGGRTKSPIWKFRTAP